MGDDGDGKRGSLDPYQPSPRNPGLSGGAKGGSGRASLGPLPSAQGFGDGASFQPLPPSLKSGYASAGGTTGRASLSETVKGLQASASSALALVAKDNPGVRKLMNGYEMWENSLRSEAKKRLDSGLGPGMHGGSPWSMGMGNSGMPMLGPGDRDLLRRVPLHGEVHGMGMKRSASENQLRMMVAPSLKAGSHHDAHGEQEAHGAHGRNGMGRFGGPAPGTNSSRASIGSSGYNFAGEAHLFGQRAQSRPPGDTGVTPSGSSGEAVTPRRHYQPREEHLVGLGIPMVPSATNLDELREMADKTGDEAARNLDRFLDNSRRAVRNAQERIQETASNCSQNLQTLSSIVKENSQQNLQALLARQQQGGASSPAPWLLASSSDPDSGALVPWSVFPHYLRTREAEAESEAKEWAAPFDSFMQALDASLPPATTGAQQLLAAQTSASVGNGATAQSKAISRSSSDHQLALGAQQQQKQGSKAGSGGGAAAQPRSIRDAGRQVAIVTTASLPWLTGTSVNPLLRAAYLSSDNTRKVTLCLPWISKSDQERLFPANAPRFDTPEAQENYVREWARNRTGLDCKFRISFYPGRYADDKGSILPVGDITSIIPDHEADIAVLEEPEHLNWYHHGRRWTDKFNHVVGVMHTNYLDYARREQGGALKEMLMKHINAWVCRVHCHNVIKLSDAVQPLPRELTMFVHGVSPAFLKVGEAKAKAAAEASSPSDAWGKGVYYIGKVLWAKGYTELLERMDEHSKRTGDNVHVDVYGSGPDLDSIEKASARKRLNLTFNGSKDHADTSIQDYKVFVNPSLSDVVATTTAEALAMGKFVVCADHPSNHFFSRFPNCLIYTDSEEFSKCLSTALKSEPKPLTQEELHALTWEAATDRFLNVADVADTRSKWNQPLEAALDNVLAAAHNTITGIEFMRQLVGAGPSTRDTPPNLQDYQPVHDEGGLFFKGNQQKQTPQPRERKRPQHPRAKQAPAVADGGLASVTVSSTK